ncbi:MAG: hypothetical protein VYD64_11515, partial [Pseudomonadota bacterium]|nr:hypothetical protein [Pseudomonadota bacterium]
MKNTEQKRLLFMTKTIFSAALGLAVAGLLATGAQADTLDDVKVKIQEQEGIPTTEPIRLATGTWNLTTAA